MTSSVGALPWVSPEVFKGEQFTEAGDIYSFGIIMWEIFTGLDPQGDLAPLTFAQKVCYEGYRPPLNAVPADVPTSISDIIKACWAQNPKDRPSFDAISLMIKQVLNKVKGKAGNLPFLATSDTGSSPSLVTPQASPMSSQDTALLASYGGNPTIGSNTSSVLSNSEGKVAPLSSSDSESATSNIIVPPVLEKAPSAPNALLDVYLQNPLPPPPALAQPQASAPGLLDARIIVSEGSPAPTRLTKKDKKDKEEKKDKKDKRDKEAKRDKKKLTQSLADTSANASGGSTSPGRQDLRSFLEASQQLPDRRSLEGDRDKYLAASNNPRTQKLYAFHDRFGNKPISTPGGKRLSGMPESSPTPPP
jgi:hypothetical protein